MNSVLIIDDHDIVRFGLETLISECAGLKLLGSASTLATGIALIDSLQPKLVISDMSVNDSTGLDTVRAVVAAQSPRRTLFVSMHDENLYGEQVLALGAHGYLMKEMAHAHVVDAALAVLKGDTWISPQLNSKMIGRLLQRSRHEQPNNTADAISTLTVREIEILECLRTGKTTKEIAFDLNLSVRTVDIHRANIKRKLGLRSGTELIAFALAKT
ncbi:MAG: response regulator transcription factor [Hylemonella sp.]|nr:response regulator transcription factor [Hylemonella sp.]